jgi:hypothetical protein
MPIITIIFSIFDGTDKPAAGAWVAALAVLGGEVSHRQGHEGRDVL